MLLDLIAILSSGHGYCIICKLASQIFKACTHNYDTIHSKLQTLFIFSLLSQLIFTSEWKTIKSYIKSRVNQSWDWFCQFPSDQLSFFFLLYSLKKSPGMLYRMTCTVKWMNKNVQLQYLLDVSQGKVLQEQWFLDRTGAWELQRISWDYHVHTLIH